MIIITICGLFLTGCDTTIIQEEPIETIIPIEEPSGEIGITDSTEIKVVATYESPVESNSTWCPTFQLVWNDMKNEIVKQDVVFMPEQSPVAELLNKESFKADMLSDEYYYKIYGLKNLELKETIEKAIKEKFDETSDILDMFDWSEDALNDENDPYTSRYFFYTMLKRVFVFPNEFEKLQNGTFGSDKNNKNVEYFGINNNDVSKYSNQVKVLFYDGDDGEYAVSLTTKSGDEVILYKSPSGTSFKEMYDNITKKSASFSGKIHLQGVDTLKIPYIKIDKKEDYPELTSKPFLTISGDVAVIAQAIQTIKFDLDEKGGKIKSEAAIDMKVSATAFEPEVVYPRHFEFDDTFVLFLKEKGKTVPYFGTLISDITLFQ